MSFSMGGLDIQLVGWELDQCIWQGLQQVLSSVGKLFSVMELAYIYLLNVLCFKYDEYSKLSLSSLELDSGSGLIKVLQIMFFKIHEGPY